MQATLQNIQEEESAENDNSVGYQDIKVGKRKQIKIEGELNQYSL
jgi:hypothetical protein